MRSLLAECFGTFCLVFAGTGAVVINNDSGGAITHVGIALTFGLIVMAMIYAIGDVSGAHINPAVTIAFYIAGRFPLAKVAPYIAAQCAGAIAASFLLKFLYPADPTLGATLPTKSWPHTFMMEIILTLLLMFVVLCVSTGAKERGITAGLVVGGTVGLAALFAGPATGASMNPARSLGPALASGNFNQLWVYLTATVAGAALAVPLCRLIRGNNCCQGCCGTPTSS
ncbi:MAG: MIP family channel protein [Verrucomicrobiota bacterium]